jgi:hypothetical protein
MLAPRGEELRRYLIKVMETFHKVSVGKRERKRPLGRPSCRREDEVRMDLGEIGWGVWSGFN